MYLCNKHRNRIRHVCDFKHSYEYSEEADIVIADIYLISEPFVINLFSWLIKQTDLFDGQILAITHVKNCAWCGEKLDDAIPYKYVKFVDYDF